MSDRAADMRHILSQVRHVSETIRPTAALMEQPSLVPALKLDGRIYAGRPGETHDELTVRRVPEEQWEREIAMGFLNHKGHFLDRQAAMTYAKTHDLLDPEHPYPQDLEADELHADLLRGFKR